MIKANELRLGNHVYQDVSTRCGKDYIHMIITKAAQIDDGKYEPIPLTPEILEQCGFEKDKDGIYCLDYPESNCKFYWIDFIQVARGYSPIFNYWHIEYLHQLQNLYFALTGKELDDIKMFTNARNSTGN